MLGEKLFFLKNGKYLIYLEKAPIYIENSTFSESFMGKNLETGKLICIKYIEKERSSEYKNEVKALKKYQK